MDHVEARARLEQRLIGPDRAHLPADEQGDRELAAHLRDCAACRREADALRETAALLALAAPDDLRAPAAARDRILRAVAETGVRRPRAEPARTGEAAMDRRWGALLGLPRQRRLALGAAVVLALLLAVGGYGLISDRDRAVRQAAELARVTAETDRLLAQPGSAVVALQTPDGAPGGTVIRSASGREIVVTSRVLEPRPGGYQCFVERDGHRVDVGYMHTSDGVAYWAGPIEGPADGIRTGDRFLVVPSHEEEPVLVGRF